MLASAAALVSVCFGGGSNRIVQPTSTLKLVMLGRSPAFHALVDGHDALLELDTGSFELRLSPEFVEKNKTDVTGIKLKIGNGQEQELKPLVEALGAPNQPDAADLRELKADGIVGLDVLRGYAIGLDTIGNRISFWQGGNVGGETANQWTSVRSESKPLGLTRIDLTTRSSEDWYRVAAKINGRPVELILDTGTYVSSVNPSLVSTLNLKKIADTEVEEIGRTEVLPVMVADSLTFGPLAADFPILNVETENDPDSDGILGSESLGQGKFLIDMPGERFYVRQSLLAKYGNPLEQRLRVSGLDIFPDPQNRLLVLVQPGSLAYQAGIRSGDAIVAFGKISVGDQDISEAGADSRHSRGTMVKIGFALLQKDLTMTTQSPDGSQKVLDLPWPKS